MLLRESTTEEDEQHVDRMYIDELKFLLIHDPDAAALRLDERKIYGHAHRGEIHPDNARFDLGVREVAWVEAADAR